MTELRVGGLTPLTTIDYPGHVAAVIFCQGCPWRCRYCHNAHLQPFRSASESRWTWPRIEAFLEERAGFLEAVVFSGGEPTAQPALGGALREVRAMGYRIGLHTAGIFPGRLRAILPLVDWVGLDIKAPFDHRYDHITLRPGTAALAEKSLRLLLVSGKPFQLRTTVHPRLLSSGDCADIESGLLARGAPATVWQTFRPQGCRDLELTAGREQKT